MKLTKRESIRECKLLWEEIEKSGLDKHGFLRTPEGEKWVDKQYRYDCPLCNDNNELSERSTFCPSCPLVEQYGKICFDLGFHEGRPSSPEWFQAIRGLKE